MLLQTIQRVTLFALLARLDQDLSESLRQRGCPHCGGPLHRAPYTRKPRGGPVDIPEEYLIRLSLCCGREGCRRRLLPPSCLFLGRKVYWAPVIFVVLTLRQGRMEGYCVRQLTGLLGINRKTLARWMAWFRDCFPQTPLWKRVRGRVSPEVANRDLPAALVLFFLAHHKDELLALAACLAFLAQEGG